MSLPIDAAARKNVPIFSGVLRYFPDALAAVAELSRIGNEQHNPGEPLHWARGKSTDHNDALTRHLLESGTIDTDGVRHSAKVAWRALAQLQTEIEEAAEASTERTEPLTWTPATEVGSAGPGDLIRSTIDPGAVETITSFEFKDTTPYPYVKTEEDPSGWYASEWWEVGR